MKLQCYFFLIIIFLLEALKTFYLLVLLFFFSRLGRVLGREGRRLVSDFDKLVGDKKLHKRPEKEEEVESKEGDVSVSLVDILCADMVRGDGRGNNTRDGRRCLNKHNNNKK